MRRPWVKKRWRLYSRRGPNGTWLVEPLGQGAERKLPKGALLSADGHWAEIHDEQGIVEVLVAAS